MTFFPLLHSQSLYRYFTSMQKTLSTNGVFLFQVSVAIRQLKTYKLKDSIESPTEMLLLVTIHKLKDDKIFTTSC